MLDDTSASAITITTTAQAGNPGTGGYVATQPGADATANTNIKGVGAVTGASVATGGAGLSAMVPSNGTTGGYAQAQTVVKAIGDNPAMATATATGGVGGAVGGEGNSSVTSGAGGAAKRAPSPEPQAHHINAKQISSPAERTAAAGRAALAHRPT